MSDTLTAPRWLLPTDWQRLTERARTVHFADGDVIVAEASPNAGLFVIADGYVRVERSDGVDGVAIARLGPGEAFGEMSLLDHAAASASVRADGPVSVGVIGHDELRTLLAADDALGARVYRGFAELLSSRLRGANEQLARRAATDVSIAPDARPALTDLVTDRQIPPDLAYAVAEFRAALWEVEEALMRRDAREPQEAVTRACDCLFDKLAGHLTDEAIVDAGYSDLVAFRDPATLAAGLGAFVFREVFPIFMASTTIARCQSKPWGYAGDPETIDRIYAGVADGDGALGPFIDRWYLSRPTCVSRRAARERVSSAIAGAGAGGVLALSCRAPREVVDALGITSPRVTLLDGDARALRHGTELLARAGVDGLVSAVHGNPATLAGGYGRVALAPQRLVYGIDVLDSLDDDAVVRVVNWAHGLLAPGGEMLLSATSPNGPDRPLQSHVVDWPVIARDAATLRALFAGTSFGSRVTIEPDVSNVRNWLSARRAEV